MQVGDKIPEIILFDTEKQEVSLNKQNGYAVLLFFPLAFTSTCTTELCSVRDEISRYNNFNATIYGISVDSLFTLGKFKEEQNLNFSLLSDFNKEASEAFGVLDETFAFGMKGVSKRSAFIVDQDGIIRYAEICPTPGDLPDFIKIKEVLEQLNN